MVFMTAEEISESVQSPDSVNHTEAQVEISEMAHKHAEVLHELESEALGAAVIERPAQQAWADGYDAITRMLVVSTSLPAEHTAR
jgi:hypothetical protein